MQTSSDSKSGSDSADPSGKFAFKNEGSQPSMPGEKGKPADFSNLTVIAFAVVAIVIFALGVSMFMGGAQPPTQQNPPLVAEKEIAALVNGKPIYLADANARYMAVPEESRGQFTLKSIVENMVDNILLQDEAAKEGVTVTDAELEQAWESQKEQAAEISRQTGISELEIKQSLKEYILVQKLIETKVAGIQPPEVTEDEALNYYNENKSELEAIALKVRASHILVEDENLASQVLADAKFGKDFAELAKEFSIDSASAINGGDLDYFRKEDMVEEFANAAFAGDVNAIYPEVVKTQFGYHIIKVTGRLEGFEALRGEIINFLGSEKLNTAKQDALEAYIQQLRDSAQIEIKVQ